MICRKNLEKDFVWMAPAEFIRGELNPRKQTTSDAFKIRGLYSRTPYRMVGTDPTQKILMAQTSENHDTSSIDSSHHPGPVRGKLTREERFRQLEEAVASGSDVEWEYEALGVTYEELMEYFDNLKESTA